MAATFKQEDYQKYLYNIVALYKQRQDLKAYLEIILSIGTIALFVIFAIKPTFVTIADLLVKINNQQQTSDQLDTKIKNLQIAQTEYNQEQTNIALLKTAVPSGPDVSSYVRQVEGTIQKNGLTESSLSIDKLDLLSTGASGSATLNLTTTITGNYQNLTNFLQDLENLRRPSILSKVDFTSGSLTTTNKTPYD